MSVLLLSFVIELGDVYLVNTNKMMAIVTTCCMVKDMISDEIHCQGINVLLIP